MLRLKAEGDSIHWVIVTDMKEGKNFSKSQVNARELEISNVAKEFNFDTVTRLGFSPSGLDLVPLSDVICKMSKFFESVLPEIVYVPFPGDAHSDHRKTYEAASACCKNFRHPSIKKVIACEIPSETEFGLDPEEGAFRPTLLVDISIYLDDKIRIMKNYAGEMGAFPFPRSEEAIRALASYRGSQAGCAAAEAFMILREIR